jgi:hypothetical protein
VLFSRVVRISKTRNRAKYFAMGTMKFGASMLMFTLHEIKQYTMHEDCQPLAICIRPVVTEMRAAFVGQ